MTIITPKVISSISNSVPTATVDLTTVAYTIFWIVLLVVAVILILRELRCWYWKINAQVTNQNEMIYLLKNILSELTKINEKNNITTPPNEEIIPATNKINDF